MKLTEWKELTRPWLLWLITGASIGIGLNLAVLLPKRQFPTQGVDLTGFCTFLILGFGSNLFSEYRKHLEIWSQQRPIHHNKVFSAHLVGVLFVFPLVTFLTANLVTVFWQHHGLFFLAPDWMSTYFLFASFCVWASLNHRFRALTIWSMALFWLGIKFLFALNSTTGMQNKIHFSLTSSKELLLYLEFLVAAFLFFHAWLRFRRREV